MAKRIPFNERPDLFRKPEDWARDWGWVSRRKAVNAAAKLEALAVIIEDTLHGDDGGNMWAKEIRRIAKSIAPATVPAQRKSQKVVAMREP